MPYMKEVIALRNGLGHSDRFSIIVGGAPITQEFSAEIGADSFGKDAVDAVKKCAQLMELRLQNADIN
jgi:5-methyltetrahydrofolate--homocysteine methyltransferase